MKNRPTLTSVQLKDSTDPPLHVHLPHLEELLLKQGYARSTIRQKTHLLIDFDQWLHKRHLKFTALHEQHSAIFLNHRRRHGHF
jgi:site-specific recombinase XerD